MKQAWVKISPWNKEIAVAAIESGADAVVASDAADTARARELGRVRVVAGNGDLEVGKDVFFLEIASKADEEKAARFHPEANLVLSMKDWTVIPIENLLAQRGNLLVEVASEAQAETMLGVLEKGVDGVVVAARDPRLVRRIVEMVHSLLPTVGLEPAVVTSVEPGGMGDRVCIDTCVNMSIGEGMLIGNTGAAFFLVHSESLENPYVAARPFRVNAGAVHAYILLPDGKTSYLSDLRTGHKTLVVNSRGATRAADIGRCKVERRPMLLVRASARESEITVYLQNAETINLTGVDGVPISVSNLKPGDSVLVHVEEGGRHFGMKINETIAEH